MAGPSPSLPAVALALLLLTGSCVGLGGDRRTTVTPAPVPTASETATPTPTAVAPGIAGNGTVDPATVVARHRRALANRSYTVTVRRLVVAGTETRGETYARSWVAGEAGRYRLVQYVNVSRWNRTGRPGRPAADVWYDGAAAYFRVTDSTGTPYVRAGNVSREVLPDPLFRPVLRDLLSVARLRPAGTSGDLLVLVGSPPVNRSVLDPPPPYGEVRNVSLRVRLSQRGVVRAARLAYDATGAGERVRVVVTVRVSGVGTTTVPVPSWAPDDGNRAAASGANGTETGTGTRTETGRR